MPPSAAFLIIAAGIDIVAAGVLGTSEHIDQHHVVGVLVDGLGAGREGTRRIDLEEIDAKEARHRLRFAGKQVAVPRGLGVLAGLGDVQALLRLQRCNLGFRFSPMFAAGVTLDETGQRRAVGRLLQRFPGDLIRRHGGLGGLFEQLQLLFGQHLVDRVGAMLGQEHLDQVLVGEIADILPVGGGGGLAVWRDFLRVAVVGDVDVHFLDIEEDLRAAERTVDKGLLLAIGGRHHVIADLAERDAHIDARFRQIFRQRRGKRAVFALAVHRNRTGLRGEGNQKVGRFGLDAGEPPADGAGGDRAAHRLLERIVAAGIEDDQLQPCCPFQ